MAEVMRAAQGDHGDRLIEFAEQILGVPLEPWQMRLCRRVFGGNVGRGTGRPDAEWPSIANMAVGTSFTAEGAGVPGTPHRFTVTDQSSRAGHRYLRCATHDGYGAIESYVDRSTIRDVTPPAVTP